MSKNLNDILGLLQRSEEFTIVSALEMIAAKFECEVATYWMLDHKSKILREARSWYASNIRFEKMRIDSSLRTFQFGEGMPGKTWKFLKVYISNDLLMDMSLPRSINVSQIGLKSGYWIPIIAEQSLVGVVELLRREPIPDSDERAANLDRQLFGSR